MDLTEGNALVVRYRRMEFIIIEDDGKEQTIPIDNGGTFQIESPCHRAEIRFPEEQRAFALGTRLLLAPPDAKYIFWTLNRCAIELKSSIIARLRELGFPSTSDSPQLTPLSNTTQKYLKFPAACLAWAIKAVARPLIRGFVLGRKLLISTGPLSQALGANLSARKQKDRWKNSLGCSALC